jgi:sugar phosphate isomerase/epimerase
MSTISVQLYSVRQEFGADPLVTLRRIADLGFRQVEPYGLVEHRAALESALSAQQLAAPTAHVKLVGADLAEVFAAALACGVGVVIEPAVRAEHWQSADGVARTAAALNDAARAAAEHGLRVGYHNHWWELQSRVGGRPALEVLADGLDPAVLLEVDAYWATAGGADTPALLGRLGERVYALHVKDGDLATDGSGQVPAGRGRVPLAEVLAAAPTALRVVEFDRYDGDIFAGLAASYAYLVEAGQ